MKGIRFDICTRRKTGKEKFTFNNIEKDFNLRDFWSYKYSNVWNQIGELAEFLVDKALESDETYTKNNEFWALWDFNYRNLRIEP